MSVLVLKLLSGEGRDTRFTAHAEAGVRTVRVTNAGDGSRGGLVISRSRLQRLFCREAGAKAFDPKLAETELGCVLYVTNAVTAVAFRGEDGYWIRLSCGGASYAFSEEEWELLFGDVERHILASGAIGGAIGRDEFVTLGAWAMASVRH